MVSVMHSQKVSREQHRVAVLDFLVMRCPWIMQSKAPCHFAHDACSTSCLAVNDSIVLQFDENISRDMRSALNCALISRSVIHCLALDGAMHTQMTVIIPEVCDAL